MDSKKRKATAAFIHSQRLAGRGQTEQDGQKGTKKGFFKL